MSSPRASAACSCGSCPPARPADTAVTHAGRTARSVPSVLLSLGIAFFPKCPFCWAAYMSVLGSLGIAKLPYLPWMLPVLVALLGLHLLVLLRQVGRGRYWPFLLSVLGAGCLLLVRTFFPDSQWLLLTGPALLVAGSLLNSLSTSLPFTPLRPTP